MLPLGAGCSMYPSARSIAHSNSHSGTSASTPVDAAPTDFRAFRSAHSKRAVRERVRAVDACCVQLLMSHSQWLSCATIVIVHMRSYV